MKRCTYCGREYPAEAQVCSLDGHSLVDCPQPLESTLAPTDGERTKWIYAFVASVLGFCFFLCLHLNSDRVRLKAIYLMAILIAVAGVSLTKLFQPWTDRVFGSPVKPGDDSASVGDSSVGPLRCTYCGKRFPEGTEVCDIDAQPLCRD